MTGFDHATIIARQLGKDLLLSVADDLEVNDDGLSFSVHGRRGLDRVRVVLLGLDRFRIEFNSHEVMAIEPLYGFQLPKAVRDRIGEYEDIQSTILELFRDAQQLARCESVYHEGLTYVFNSERPARARKKIDWTNQRRRLAETRVCACGCGKHLPWTRFPDLRIYATHACALRICANRSKKKRRQKWIESDVPTCRLCGGPIPRTSPAWFRKHFCRLAHKVRFFKQRRLEREHGARR